MLPVGFKLIAPDEVLKVNAPLVGLTVLVLTLPAITLPVTLARPAVNKLPPVMLAELVIVDVADIRPPVKMLPPCMLPLTDTTAPVWLATFTMLVNIPLLAVTLAVALICPPVRMLPPVTLAVALTKPPVNKLPPVTLAVTDTTAPK